MNGREKKRNVSTLVYLEATSGRRRRRLRATHGGNPYIRVRPRRGSHTHTQQRTLYTHIRRGSALLSHSRMAAIESTRARERERRDRTAYRVGKEAGLRRDTHTRVHTHTYTRHAYTRHRPGTARAKLTLT